VCVYAVQVKLLLQHADAGKTDSEGCNALHCALSDYDREHTDPAVVRLLFQHFGESIPAHAIWRMADAQGLSIRRGFSMLEPVCSCSTACFSCGRVVIELRSCEPKVYRCYYQY
jgi:hypothetical protein